MTADYALSSLNGFPISSIEVTNAVCLSKADFTTGTSLWCLIELSPWLVMNVLSNYARVLDNSGPATIQRVNALRLSVRPIACHGPFTKLLFYSCAWSVDMPDDTLCVFRITKFPAWNSLCTSG